MTTVRPIFIFQEDKSFTQNLFVYKGESTVNELFTNHWIFLVYPKNRLNVSQSGCLFCYDYYIFLSHVYFVMKRALSTMNEDVVSSLCFQ